MYQRLKISCFKLLGYRNDTFVNEVRSVRTHDMHTNDHTVRVRDDLDKAFAFTEGKGLTVSAEHELRGLVLAFVAKLGFVFCKANGSNFRESKNTTRYGRDF